MVVEREAYDCSPLKQGWSFSYLCIARLEVFPIDRSSDARAGKCLSFLYARSDRDLHRITFTVTLYTNVHTPHRAASVLETKTFCSEDSVVPTISAPWPPMKTKLYLLHWTLTSEPRIYLPNDAL